MRQPVTESEPTPTRAATAALARPHLPAWLMGGLLALVTLALYWPATGFDFINYDDPGFVTSNVHVRGGLNWEGVKWAFGLNGGDYWHPLTWLSLMMDVSLFGRGAGGFHFTNIAFHAANGVLLFLLLQMMTGSLWRSAVAAALFALHPLRVESVAWVTERKDVLSGCFGLFALICYARYATRGQRSEVGDQRSGVWGLGFLSHLPASVFYLLSLCFFACGLMSKATLVTWPFVMLLLDLWPLQRFQLLSFRLTVSALRRLVREKIPFFVLSGISCFLTYYTERGRQIAAGFEEPPALLRLENALMAYTRYLGKTFWPGKLAVPYVNPGHWSWLEVGGSVLALVGVCLIVLWLGRRRLYLFVGWCWFLGTMIPVIGLTKGWALFMADRYTYLSSVGVMMLVVWGVCELTRGWRDRVVVLSVGGGTVIALCLVLTRQQMGYWRDSEALFRHAIEVTENNDAAHNSLGVALVEKDQPDEAVREFREALRLKPHYAYTRYNLGIALLKNGEVGEAINHFQEFLRLKPDDAEAHHYLGKALAMKDQMDGAIRQFREALRLNPEHTEAHNYLGIALFKEGQVDEAISHYQSALRLRPDYADARDNLGAALIKKGQVDEAISQFQEASRLKPGDATMHNNLGAALEKKGRVGEAIGHYMLAIRLKADYADAHNNLGHALLKSGQIDAVIGEFQEAVRLKPADAEAHYNLGIALFRKGQIDEAIRQYQEALRLKPDYASAHNNLGAAFMSKGQIDAAISQFQQALRLKPDQASAHNNLGIALGQNGRTGEAIREFQAALRLNPDYANARTNLEAALATQADSARLPGTSTNR